MNESTIIDHGNALGLTALESLTLYALTHDEYNSINGTRVTFDTTIDDLHTWSTVPDVGGYDTKSVRGAMGSLAAKGYIVADGVGRDATILFENVALNFACAIDTVLCAYKSADTIGDRIARALVEWGYSDATAVEYGRLWEAGVRDARMSDAVLVLGSELERASN